MESTRNHWVHIPLASSYPTSGYDWRMKLRCFISNLRDSLLLLQPTPPPDGSVYSHSSWESQTLSYHHHHHQTFHSSWPAWDLLPCLSSGCLTSWTSELSSLHSYCLDLEGSSLLCFWGNSQLCSPFPNKNPFCFPQILKLTRKTGLNWPQHYLDSLCDFWLLAVPGSLHSHVRFSTAVM